MCGIGATRPGDPVKGQIAMRNQELRRGKEQAQQSQMAANNPMLKRQQQGTGIQGLVSGTSGKAVSSRDSYLVPRGQLDQYDLTDTYTRQNINRVKNDAVSAPNPDDYGGSLSTGLGKYNQQYLQDKKEFENRETDEQVMQKLKKKPKPSTQGARPTPAQTPRQVSTGNRGRGGGSGNRSQIRRVSGNQTTFTSTLGNANTGKSKLGQ